MYCDTLTAMFNQYLDSNRIDHQLWEQLGQCWTSTPSASPNITLRCGSSDHIVVNPWSLAVASKDLHSTVCEALLKDPNAHHNMFAQLCAKPPLSFFDFVIKSANHGHSKEKIAACVVLDQIHERQKLPSCTVVLTAPPRNLPENLALWAIAHDMGVLDYYSLHKTQPHTSSAWQNIEAYAQNIVLTNELSSYGETASRKLKL